MHLIFFSRLGSFIFMHARNTAYGSSFVEVKQTVTDDTVQCEETLMLKVIKMCTVIIITQSSQRCRVTDKDKAFDLKILSNRYQVRYMKISAFELALYYYVIFLRLES